MYVDVCMYVFITINLESLGQFQPNLVHITYYQGTNILDVTSLVPLIILKSVLKLLQWFFSLELGVRLTFKFIIYVHIYVQH